MSKLFIYIFVFVNIVHQLNGEVTYSCCDENDSNCVSPDICNNDEACTQIGTWRVCTDNSTSNTESMNNNIKSNHEYHIDYDFANNKGCDGVNVGESDPVQRQWTYINFVSFAIKWIPSTTRNITGFSYFGYSRYQGITISAALFKDNNSGGGNIGNVISKSASRATMPTSSPSQINIDIDVVEVIEGEAYWIVIKFHFTRTSEMRATLPFVPGRSTTDFPITDVRFTCCSLDPAEAGDMTSFPAFFPGAFQIEVICNTAPNAVCQDVVKVADATCSASIVADEVNNGSTDADGDSLSYSVTPTSFSGTGSTNVELTVSDNELSDTCSATVTVQDTTPPVITCPSDTTLECTEDTSSSNTGEASATDNCDPLFRTITHNDAVSGDDDDTPNDYIITRTWTAVDDDNNESQCVQTITVQDTEAPTSDGENTFEIGPPNHKMHSISLEQCLDGVTFSDNCEDEDYVRNSAKFVSVSSNEDENGNGDGNTNQDHEVVSDDEVEVRAERSGNGDGRVYTLTYEFNDSSGNTNSANCYVNVPHNNGNGNGKKKSVMATVTSSATSTTLSVVAVVAVLVTIVVVGGIIRRRRHQSHEETVSATNDIELADNHA